MLSQHWVTPLQDTECHRPTNLEHCHVTCSHWLVTQSVTSYIYTTRAQDLGSVVVDSSLACLAFGSVESTPSCTGSTVHIRQLPLLRERPPVERARPRCIPFRVLPWSQPNLVWRSGVPGDVRYLRTVYIEYEINASVEFEQQ